MVQCRDMFAFRAAKTPPLQVIEIKAVVRHRDGYKCVDCGMTATQHIRRFGTNLHVHRTIPGAVYEINSCVTLCRPCHKKRPISPRGEGGNPLAPRYRTVSINEKLWLALKAYARTQRRSVNAQAAIMIEEHLRKHGFWPPPDDDGVIPPD